MPAKSARCCGGELRVKRDAWVKNLDSEFRRTNQIADLIWLTAVPFGCLHAPPWSLSSGPEPGTREPNPKTARFNLGIEMEIKAGPFAETPPMSGQVPGKLRNVFWTKAVLVSRSYWSDMVPAT